MICYEVRIINQILYATKVELLMKCYAIKEALSIKKQNYQ